MKKLFVVLLAGLLMAGCGSFWEDQGAASRTAAEARLRQAEAQRQNAQAAIIDAEARGALAQSQAKALTTAMDANVSLTRQAIGLADNGEYVVILSGVALAALLLALAVVIVHGQRHAAAPSPRYDVPQIERGITIETPVGPVRMIQEPGETRYHFMVRVRALTEAVQADQALIQAPTDGAATR